MAINSKKIFLFIIFIITSLFSINNIYAIGVDEVFTDISKDYKYYHELQSLYDKGIIKANTDGYFFPNDLLKRDDFVGIVSEVSCNKCIYPNTPAPLVSKYYGVNTFFDVAQINKNYYCIEDMAKKGFVKGYDLGYVCNDGTKSDGEAPFCANNYVTREEAIAVLLRSSNIFTIEDNNLVKQKIISGDITADLAYDVAPIEGGVVNTFYGYLQKALDYSLTEKIVGEDGNITEKIYYLLEKNNNEIHPDDAITREEYILMAYVIFRKNSCNFKTTEDNTLSAQIEIFDASCDENKINCQKPTTSKNKYDFNGYTDTSCKAGIKDYKWIFNYLGDAENPYKKIFTTKYVNDYDFKDNTGKLLSGDWNVTLEVTDNCANSSTISKTVFISEKSDFNVDMIANPKVGKATLNTNFEAKVYGNVGNLSYSWIFGDGNTAMGRVVENPYKKPGYYNATLIVTDKQTGQKVSETVVIHVLDDNSDSDIDKDGIFDKNDDCVSVYGVEANNGCPIFDDKCESDSDCVKGKMCEINSGYCVLDTDGDKVPDNNDNCRLTPGLVNNAGCPLGAIGENCNIDTSSSGVCGSASCNSCPCDNKLDFKADLRKCDLVFPTILSPDGKNIYARGDNKIINN